MAGIDEYTKLLLHFDGDYTDSSTSEIVPITNAGVTLNSTNTKFNSAGCASFNIYESMTKGILTIPYDANLVIGSNSFTVDFWVKGLFVNCPYCSFTFLYGAEVFFGFEIWDSRSKFTVHKVGDGVAEWSTGIILEFTGTEPFFWDYAWSIFDPTVWNHFALCVGAGYAELFINGVSQGNKELVNDFFGDYPVSYSIFGDSWEDPLSQTLLDEYRVSIGIKRWVNNFDPPTEPYSLDAVSLPVRLILSMNGADESQVFVDSSAAPHTVVAAGNVKQDTGWYQLGTASGQFNSSSDYLSITSTTNWEIFNNPFTIHFWLRPVNITGNQSIFKQYQDDSTYILCTYNHSNKLITFEVKIWNKQRIYIQVTADLPLNEFSHIAIVGS